MNQNPSWRSLAHARLEEFRHGELDEGHVRPTLWAINCARMLIDGLQQGPDCITATDEGAIVVETIIKGHGPRIVVRHEVDSDGVHMCLLVDSVVVLRQEPPR